jgi:uncharacterized protein YceH (UPF0502 family)
LVKVLRRQPGTKESRYAHLLCGDVADSPALAAADLARLPLSNGDRAGEGASIARLESEIANLRSEVADLKQQFAQFRKQFE